MMRDAIRRRVGRLLPVLLVGAALGVCAWIYGAVESYRLIETTKERTVRIVELRGRILQLDEVLTMSARMMAATGDPAWERRYREHEPQLVGAIHELLEVAPPDLAHRAIEATDQANSRLVEMETLSFERVAQGNQAEARNILFSAEYERQKEIYNAAMMELAAGIEAGLHSALRREQQKTALSIGGAVLLLAVLVGALVAAVRTLRRSGAVLQGELEKTQRAGESLKRMRDELEVRVEESVDAQRRTEEALRRSQEMLVQSQKMEAIGRLAGGIAHDFNNMLSAILGYSELIQANLRLDAETREYVGEIRKAGKRASGLTGQLLAFSRRQMRQVVSLDLNAVVGDLESMLRRLIGEDVDLSLALDPALGRINADPGQLQQVIMNLVVNARDAVAGGGRIRIETTGADVAEALQWRGETVPPGSYSVLSVADTGAGIPPEVQEHLFEPFFTTKPQGQGTGLGLSTVYGVVKQSGGHIHIESSPAGTRFAIYFPRIGAAAVAPERRSERVRCSGSETILLVEDEEIVRKLEVDILRRSGYTVLEAVDGRAGLELFRRERSRIDLVLTDVVMPVMGGREMVDQVRELKPDARVLFMTGYTDDSVLRHGVQSGKVPVLPKPFTPTALLLKVREAIIGAGCPSVA